MSSTTSRPKLNIVPDTGFYIAAALKNGYARSYLTGRGSKFLTYELYSSEAILLETQEKLETKFGFDRLSVVRAIKEIRNILTNVYPTQRLSVVRDPDDDKILECAVEARADLIVTFDKDLLTLRAYEGIKIIHPAMLKYLFPKAFKF
jgi:putative PIN family toxin of toxin-antitoxin system